MSKKKKVFLIVYVIALLAVITLLINRIIAAESSVEKSEGTVNMVGSYVGKKLDETTGDTTIPPANIYDKNDIDFSNDSSEDFLNWVKNGHYIDYVQVRDNISVFCLDKDKRIHDTSFMMNQRIVKVTEVTSLGYKNGLEFTDVGLSDTVYPTNGTWASESDIPDANYLSVIYNWDNLEAEYIDQDSEDFDEIGGFAGAFVFAHRDEYQNKLNNEDTEYTDAQYAFWAILKGYNDVKNIVDDKTIDEEKLLNANQLLKRALAFKEYRDNFKAPSLESSNGKYKFKYVANGDYFIAGPVTIKYPALETTAGDEVGAIESLKLIGKDINGNEVNIEHKITDKNGADKEFSKDDGNYEFYIKVENSEIKAKKIRYIEDFTIKFKYMNIKAEGYKLYDPTKSVLEYYEWVRKSQHSGCYVTHKHGSTTFIEDTDDDGFCEGCKGPKSVTHNFVYQLKRDDVPITTAELQPVFICGKTEIFWEYYELKITFKPDGGLPTYLDLGGKVWVDNYIDNGKVIDNANGILDNGEYGRENVLVELFFFDGTPVQVGVKDTLKDNRNTNLINKNGFYAVYTDSNGEYMFYGLPVDQKYFVRFTYDGQTYEKTLYLADGSESDYQNDPNREKYDNNSKVKDEIDRTGFNNRFEKITYANIRERGTGKASGATMSLSYIFKTYKEKEASYIKSKIITTDNRTDAEYGESTRTDIKKQTGKAIDPFKIQARTPDSLKYPFEKNGEVIIWSSEAKYIGLEGNALHYLRHINLGLKFRPKADFQLSTQIKAGATTIKDKEKVVIYPQSAKMSDLENDFTRQEDEYIKQEISAADYNWVTEFENIYGSDGSKYYVVDKDKLHVYVLYRIAIKNQCDDANDYGIINEIIDYYDNRLERVTGDKLERACKLFRDAKLKVPSSACESWIEGTDTRVEWTSSGTVGNYQMMKSTTPITVGAGNSESAIYLILKVKDNGNVLETGGKEDDPNDGMQNIAEIGSYTVKNGNNVVGKIDKDSAPGNAIPGKKETYEDDTCASPMFKLKINWTPKEIKGIVWNDVAPGSEGTYALGDIGVDGVTVKLIEYIVKDGKIVDEIERPGIEINGKNLTVNKDQSVKTKNGGKYNFYVEGGNYSLKFIYGDQEMLKTNKKYNAQDYQALNSPNYKALSGTEVPGYNEKNKKLNAFATQQELEKAYTNFLVVGQEDYESNLGWNIDAIFGLKDDEKKKTQAQEETKDVPTTKNNNYSNVRDKANIRADIIRNTQNLIYDKASKLNELSGDGVVSKDTASFLSGGNTAESRHKYDGSGNYTYMEAVSDIITIASNDLITEPNVINLGLKERPTASRKLEKKVDRITLTASDGTVLVDTKDNTKLSGVQNLDGYFQQTFINLEPGLMDGALLDIDYTLTVTNDSTGDDCLQNYVYVNNSRDNDTNTLKKLRDELYPSYELNTSLPIRATIFDYVNINLEYRAEDNSNGTIWDNIYEESGSNTIGKLDENTYSGWLTSDARNEINRSVKKVSKVLQTHTDKFDNDGLLAGESVQIPIHLGITLSEDTSGKNLNDFDFSNCAELTQITTTAGRRDYETVPGDYIPYNTDEANKKQADAFLTGTTAITPPLGEGRFYYVIAIVSASIILVGIVLIKKKVLKK